MTSEINREKDTHTRQERERKIALRNCGCLANLLCSFFKFAIMPIIVEAPCALPLLFHRSSFVFIVVVVAFAVNFICMYNLQSDKIQNKRSIACLDREKSVDFHCIPTSIHRVQASLSLHYLLYGIIGKFASVRYIKCSLAGWLALAHTRRPKPIGNSTKMAREREKLERRIQLRK